MAGGGLLIGIVIGVAVVCGLGIWGWGCCRKYKENKIDDETTRMCCV